MADNDVGARIDALEGRCAALEKANVALTALLTAPQPLPLQAATATLQPYSPKGPTAPYEVLSPIFHGGKRRKVGDVVQMTEDEAAPVLKLEAVQRAVAKPAPKAAAKK
jgi:hypothetical protein